MTERKRTQRILGPAAAAAVLLLAACAAREAAPPPPPPVSDAQVRQDELPRFALGPMVGHVTDESAILWAKADRPGVLAVTLTGEDGTTASGRAALDADGIGTVEVEDLSPATRYAARFQLDGLPVSSEPAVSFHTYPEEDEPARLTIALVSCARVPWDSVQSVWGVIDAANPDLVLWLGDNGYLEHADSANPADYSDPARMEFRNAEMRGLASLQPLLRHVPQYAIWDDRDFGPSDSDRTFPLREEIGRIFERYWANPSYGNEPGLDGIWSSFEVGEVEVFLLDDRWARDPDTLPDGPGKTVLGAEQKAWLLEGLADSDARVKIVAIGHQVLADYHEWESYAQFANERKEILDWIHERRIEGVVFVDGDRHLVELMRWTPDGGYPLYEFTVSPVANRFFESGLELPNPIRIGGYGASPNFGLLEIDTTTDAGRIVFRALDTTGREVLRHETTIDALEFPDGIGDGRPAAGER